MAEDYGGRQEAAAMSKDGVSNQQPAAGQRWKSNNGDDGGCLGERKAAERSKYREYDKYDK